MHEQTEIYGYFNLQSKVTFVNANQCFWTFILGVSIIDDVIFFNFLITQKYQQEIWTKKIHLSNIYITCNIYFIKAGLC